jgi:hypothetical protein
MDLEQEYYLDADPHHRKPKKDHDRTIKIDDEIFEQAVREGIIEETNDGYVFKGKYKDIKKLKKNKKY